MDVIHKSLLFYHMVWPYGNIHFFVNFLANVSLRRHSQVFLLEREDLSLANDVLWLSHVTCRFFCGAISDRLLSLVSSCRKQVKSSAVLPIWGFCHEMLLLSYCCCDFY